jgi:hypothetical protein
MITWMQRVMGKSVAKEDGIIFLFSAYSETFEPEQITFNMLEQNKQQNKNINFKETRKLSAFQILIVKCFRFIPGPMGTTLSSKRS